MSIEFERDNVRVIPDAGDVEIVGADTIAKLSAETSEDRSPAAWDQRIVIQRVDDLGQSSIPFWRAIDAVGSIFQRPSTSSATNGSGSEFVTNTLR